MEVYLQSITGWDDAITSLFMSRGTWTPELGDHIHSVLDLVLNRRGFVNKDKIAKVNDDTQSAIDDYSKWCNSLFKYGSKHITMMRFLDFTFVVVGLHRAAQDDWDAHAYRFNNRIIRLSTRYGSMKNADTDTKDLVMSDYYKDKVLTLGQATNILGIELPDTIMISGVNYVRGINGYVREDYQCSSDVKRGLYPLGMSSMFTFKCNFCEYPHIRDLRMRKTPGHEQSGHAHPEIWDLVDMIDNALCDAIPGLSTEWFDSVKQ
jgi:hypothetical protein